MDWKWGGVQASDGCLMGLGAHAHLSNRVGPQGPSLDLAATVMLSGDCTEHVPEGQQDCDTGLGTGLYFNELEQYVGFV